MKRHDCLTNHPSHAPRPQASAVSFDTSKNGTIPFASCFSPDNSHPPSLYAYSLDDYVLKPLEDQGVNFWWIDWQQGPTEGGCMGGPVGGVGGEIGLVVKDSWNEATDTSNLHK